MLKLRHYAFLAGVCASSMTHAQNASVQNAPPAQQEVAGDIVVTAQKRSENLRSVPVSITAITGNTLAAAHITQAADITTSVPNLRSTSPIGDNVPIFALRGISQSDFNVNQDSPIATYYDGVYKGSFALVGVGFFDVERVEVLRGPQGTLYGKNATGGAINIISKKPTFDTSGYVSVGYGNYNRHEFEGAVGGKLTDTVAARISGTFAQADGWYHNSTPGAPDLNSTKQYALRAQLLFEPSSTFSYLVQASTSLQNPQPYGVYTVPYSPGVGGDVYAGLGLPTKTTPAAKQSISSTEIAREHLRTYAVSGTGNLHVAPSLELTSVTAFDYGKMYILEDSDGTSLPVQSYAIGATARQFSEDLRLTSTFSGPLNFILGGYYNHTKTHVANVLGLLDGYDANGDGVANAADCAQGAASGIYYSCYINSRYVQTRNSIAVYSDAQYALSDRLKLRLGLRYTRDTGRQDSIISQAVGADGQVVANLIPGGAANLNDTMSQRFVQNNVSGKVGVDFKTASGDLLYASFSKGYRAPSFNGAPFFSSEEVNISKAEKLDSWEAGYKARWLNRMLDISAAGFYYTYNNSQFISLNTNFVPFLANLPKARVYGLELEATLRPASTLTLNGGLGLLDSKVLEGTIQGVDVVGNQLLSAAKLTANASVDWTLLKSEQGKLAIRVDASYISRQYFTIFNDQVDRDGRGAASQAGYALVNMGVSYSLLQGITIRGWVKNLTDKFYLTSALGGNSYLGYTYNHRGTPRMYGGTVEYRF